jgi:imidazolonepropionase-like amidohydrolase
MIANPLLFTNPAEFERYRRVIDAFGDDACAELADVFARNGTWQVPTLIRLRTMAYADDAGYRNDARLHFVPVATRALWNDLADQFAMRMPDVAKRAVRDLYALQERLVERFARASVPMLAGSDLGGQWVIPGAGLHQEFDLLAAAGLSPLAILQMTTRDGARFLGLERDLGSVAVGAYADLVVLDADPIASAAALHAVSGVLRADRYYDRQALESLKASAAQLLAPQRPNSSSE